MEAGSDDDETGDRWMKEPPLMDYQIDALCVAQTNALFWEAEGQFITVINCVNHLPNTVKHFTMRYAVYKCNIIRFTPCKVTKCSTQPALSRNNSIFATVLVLLLSGPWVDKVGLDQPVELPELLFLHPVSTAGV